MSCSQLAPAGPFPGPVRLLSSGLLWADASTVIAAARLVLPEDLDEPHRTIVDAVYRLAAGGRTGPRLVLDELQRTGMASQSVGDELAAATTAGGQAVAVPAYCAQVLAVRFRTLAESYGAGIVGWADSAAEDDLWTAVTTGGAELRRVHDRLALARGGVS